MKKKIILTIAMSAIVSSVATAIAIGNGSKTARLLAAYYDYYIATELWLDEMEKDYGDLMTGSDCNAEYLEARYALNELIK